MIWQPRVKIISEIEQKKKNNEGLLCDTNLIFSLDSFYTLIINQLRYLNRIHSPIQAQSEFQNHAEY